MAVFLDCLLLKVFELFCHTLLSMIDANCQRSASSSALVLSNPYKGFGNVATLENLIVMQLYI